jgi:hypothetical protein
LPSARPAWRWLAAKECRELLHAPAFWVLLLLTGPLVGASFAGAVRTYAELSGLGGTVAGVGEAFSPLVGVWGPTFSAYELVAAFLLPFLAIRVMSVDRQTGASRLEEQGPLSNRVRIAVKAAVLGLAWLVASLPAVAALALWRSYGGAVHWPELASVWIGHLLNAGLTIALAAAASSVAEHPSTAAILTLAFTVGTWVVSFAAAVHGGVWERLASLTPPVMVAEFQRGLVRLDLVLIAAVLTIAGLGVAATWASSGVAVRRRATQTLGWAVAAAAFVMAATHVHASRDLSEDRRNSLPAAQERALRALPSPVTLRVHLASEDARRTDLERRLFSKLRRVAPSTRIEYVAATSVGLFEQSDPSYASIDYDVAGRHRSSRTLTVDGVLANVFAAAEVEAPEDEERDAFRGHPLAVPPRGAGTVFYAAWPALVMGAALFTLRRPG